MLSAVGISSVLAPGAARADAPPTTLHLLVPEDARSDLRGLIDAMEGQLADTNVALTPVPLDVLPRSLEDQIGAAHALVSSERSLAVVWCELYASAKIYLYYTEGRQGRILVREITEPDNSSRAEAISIIVRSFVAQLLEGQRIGIEAAQAIEESARASRSPQVPRPSAPVSAPTSAPPAPLKEDISRPLVAWQGELAYLLAVHSRQFPAVSGFSVGLDATFAGRWRVFGQYLVMQSLKRRGSTATLELRRHPLVFGLGGVWMVRKLELGLATALVVDIATFANVDLQEGYESVADREDVLLSLAPGLRLSYTFIERLSLALSVGVEVPLNRQEYTAITESGAEKVIVPWPVQPLLQLGVVIDVF